MIVDDEILSKKGNRSFLCIAEPTIEPVSVDEVKDFARIDGSDEDSSILNFIRAARKAAEDFLGRAFIEQTWRLSFDWWGSDVIDLPRPPLINVSSFNLISEGGVATPVNSSYYYLITDAIPGKLVYKSTSPYITNEIRNIGGYQITYTAGYGSIPDNVPEILKTAIKQWAVAIYESRAMTGEAPPDVMEVLKMYRVGN